MTTNGSSPRVRAVAQVAGSASAKPAGRPSPRRTPGRVGAVGIGQILLVELALVLVLVVTDHPVWMVAAAGAVTVIVVVLVFGRVRGRWLSERFMLRWRLNRRRERRPVRDRDRRLEVLNALAPGLQVTDVTAAGEKQIGIGRDGSGWFGALAVVATESLRGDVQLMLPMAELAQVAVESEVSGAVIQVVTHTVPAPSLDIDPRRPGSSSYQGIAVTGAEIVPADQVTWVSVRLDATAAAEVVSAGADPVEVPQLLNTLLGRAGKVMKRAGLGYRMLDADGLLDALIRSCALDREGTRAAEQWSHWEFGGYQHACFWVQDWPEVGVTNTLMQKLSASRSAFTSVALIMEPDREDIDLRCLVRVVAPGEQLAAVCAEVGRVATGAGAKLFRLDGEHAPAVYASAPSGGGGR